MDIAKIRKKLKDTGDKQSSGDARASGAEEDSSVAEPVSGPQDTPHEPETAAAGADASYAEPSPGGEPESPEEYRRHEEDEAGAASEPETVIPEAEVVLETPFVEPSPAMVEVTERSDRGAPSADIRPRYEEEKEDQGGDGAKEDDVLEILTFGLLGEEFALKISQLKEILKYQRITEVPRMPRYVLGITSLRGKVIPVIDLRIKILPYETAPGVGDKTKILILKGPKGMIGALVDKVSGVMRIAKSQIMPPPTHLSEEQLRFIEGVAVLDKRFVSIVNMEEATAIHFE